MLTGTSEEQPMKQVMLIGTSEEQSMTQDMLTGTKRVTETLPCFDSGVDRYISVVTADITVCS